MRSQVKRCAGGAARTSGLVLLRKASHRPYALISEVRVEDRRLAPGPLSSNNSPDLKAGPQRSRSIAGQSSSRRAILVRRSGFGRTTPWNRSRVTGEDLFWSDRAGTG